MKKKKVNEIFQVEKGDIISIVGSGGKTSLLFELSKELKNNYKVLVTTSTKIYKPSCQNYDYLYTSIEEYKNRNTDEKDDKDKKNSVTVISKKVDMNQNKLIGIDSDDLKSIDGDFDLVLIESDGSRNLPLKGWKENEPAILSATNKTIGVIPIDIINKKINKEFIYGYEEFKKIVGNINLLDFEAIGKLCLNKLGLFKNSRGKLFLYINKADNELLKNEAFQLAKFLENNIVGKYCDLNICFGSLKQGEFYEY